MMKMAKLRIKANASIYAREAIEAAIEEMKQYIKSNVIMKDGNYYVIEIETDEDPDQFRGEFMNMLILKMREGYGIHAYF